MSNHKTIKINPELFSLTKQKKTKPDATQAKTKKNTTFKPNNIKNKLLERIKAHKNKEANLGSQSSSASDIEAQSNEFDDSMAYLSSLARQSKETTNRDAYVQNTQNAMTGGKSKTLKNYAAAPSPSLHVELELPDGLKESPMVFYAPIPPANEPPMTLTPPNASYLVDNKVPYGCLKGGVKPTFKTWNKTQRQQPAVEQHTPSLNINTSSLGGSSNTTLRETKMKELKEKMRRKQQSLEFAQPPPAAPALVPRPAPMPAPISQSEPNPERNMDVSVATLVQEAPVMMIMTDQAQSNPTPSPSLDYEPPTQHVQTGGVSKRIKKTIKRTYTLGKSKIHKKVGILIKDKNTRKRVLNAQRDIKRHGINDIKQYLRTHGLIKTGSSAPNDIIRKIYESAMLSGEVTNQDKDILLQNFLKEKDE
jgi:hypothetical protein